MLTTAEKIKVIMKRNNFTMTELANQLNCSRQNLSIKCRVIILTKGN